MACDRDRINLQLLFLNPNQSLSKNLQLLFLNPNHSLSKTINYLLKQTFNQVELYKVEGHLTNLRYSRLIYLSFSKV